jgi:hypothetical protein
MAETANESADADTDGEAREEYPWASQTPGTRIVGKRRGVIYAGRLDDTEAQNDTSFGVIIEDPEVVEGTLWQNQAKPDDATTAEGVDDDQSRPTDYRIADPDDENTTIANGALVTGENGPNTYDEADAFDEDTVILWYNGLSGERLSRVLDFNGRPFARWTDDGYLVKGLYQPAEGWREANGDKRSQMKENGKAPRVARAPLLRDRVDVQYDDEGNVDGVEVNLEDDFEGAETLIDMSYYMGGRGYEIHALDAETFEDEFGALDATIPRNDAGYVKDDVESELDMPYTPAADQVLEEAGFRMHMYTGDGWQDEPDSWTPQSTSEVGTFGVSADAGSDDGDGDGFTAQQEQFVREVVDEVSGTGMPPSEVFEGGIPALLGRYGDQFDRVPDESDVREAVYARVSHLSTDDLEE